MITVALRSCNKSQLHSYWAFLTGVVPINEGCFQPTLCNSFVFKVKRLKFCTELLGG